MIDKIKILIDAAVDDKLIETLIEICKIEKNGSFLGFTHIGYATEAEHLKPPKKKEVVKTVSSDGKKRKSRRTMSGRMFRSELATYQIDMVDKLVDDAFEIFTK